MYFIYKLNINFSFKAEEYKTFLKISDSISFSLFAPTFLLDYLGFSLALDERYICHDTTL